MSYSSEEENRRWYGKIVTRFWIGSVMKGVITRYWGELTMLTDKGILIALTNGPINPLLCKDHSGRITLLADDLCSEEGCLCTY